MTTATITSPSADYPSGFNTSGVTVTWTYTGGTQDQFHLTIQRISDGTILADSGVLNSTATTYTFAGGIPDGVPVQIILAVHDSAGNQAYATRNLTSNYVQTLTITDPVSDDPASFPNSSYLTKWTYTSSAGGVQDQYRVQVQRASDGFVYGDTGVINGSANSFYINGSFPSGVRVYIIVTTHDTVGKQTTTYRAVTPNFAGPPVPTFVLSKYDAVVQLVITNPTSTGSQPTTTLNGVQRRLTGTTAWTTIATTTANGTYVDRTVQAGKQYDYQIAAQGSNGNYSGSIVQTFTAPTWMGVWMHSVSDPNGSPHTYPYAAGSRVRKREVESSTLAFIGRALPIVEFGTQETGSISVPIMVPWGDAHAGDISQLESYLSARTVLCYRDNRGRKIFGYLDGGLSLSDDVFGTTVGITITAVDYQEGV